MSEQKEEPLPILFYIIKIILYIIGFIIIVITFLSIINYIFYVYYYIKETIITNENLYDVNSLKLADIHNYKLINYIKEFNNKYNKYNGVGIDINDNCKCYDIKNLNIYQLEYKDQQPINVLDFDFTTMFNKIGDFRENISKIESDISKAAPISTYTSTLSFPSITGGTGSSTPIGDIPQTTIANELNKYWPPKNGGYISRIDFNKFSNEDINLLHKFGIPNDKEAKEDLIYGIYKYKYKNQDEENYYFQIKIKEASTQQCNLNKNNLQSINTSLYNDIISNINEKENDKKKEIKVVGINGILVVSNLSEKNNNTTSKDMFGDVFGYVLNRMYILFPNNLYYSYDKSSNLYISTNNKLYELIFAIIFIIFLIIAISVTIDIVKIIISVFIDTKLHVPVDSKSLNYTDKFYASIKSTEEKDYESTSLKLITNPDYYYLIIIPLIITLYCIIHSIIYYYLFIKGAYINIIESYEALTEPDELIRNEIFRSFNKNITITDIDKYIKINKEILLLFENISYGGDIDIISGKYAVINTAENDQNLQLKNFEEKMLVINKHFSYNERNYEANIFTESFFTEFKKLYDRLIGTEGDIVEYKKCMKLILVIYIYIIEWDNKDPYILMKLNKIIFGRVANIQNIKIDEDIESILALRSIIPYDTDKYIKPDLVKIYIGVCKYIEPSASLPVGVTDLKISNPELKESKYIFDYSDDVKIYIDFQNKFERVLNYDITKSNYYYNLYLALEMGLNILVILIILILLKLMTSNKNSEVEKNITYAQLFASWIFTQIVISVFGIINVLRFVY
jgi:hypothetical protein